MHRSVALVVVAACGGKQPAPAVATKQLATPVPLVVTCSDVGVILRGDVSVDNDRAGPAREAVIAKACSEDRWPQRVMDCIASTPRAADCLGQLDQASIDSLGRRLSVWSDEYGDQEGSAGNPARLPEMSCREALVDLDAFDPPLGKDAPERAWTSSLRTEVILHACDHDWNDSLKTCIAAAVSDTSKITACLDDKLDRTELDELAHQLTELDRLATAIAAAKKKPASNTCAKMVTSYYGDAKWQGKLDGIKPAERKRLIEASRAALTKACTSETWWSANDTARACVIAAGGQTCFAGSDKVRWGYPATGTVTSTGIAECDAYAAAVSNFASCTKLPQDSRDTIVRSQQQMLVEIVRLPAADRASSGTNCKAAMDAIAESLTGAGC